MIRIRWTAFRIAIAFALALTATTYTVFALVYWQFYASNIAVVRAILQDEANQTTDLPLDRLKHRLELRLTQDLRHLDYVGLYAKSGALVFGNIAQDVAIPVDGRSRIIPMPTAQLESWQSENAIFVAAQRSDGGKLVLGRSLVYVEKLEGAMLRGFAIAIVPIIILALAIGTIISLRASRRLTAIQQAIDRVMQGELEVRLPARGTPDDIDALVRAVNQMLDEIVRLVSQIKGVGDNIAHDLRSPLAVMRARLERGVAGSSEETLRAVATESLNDLDRAMTTVTALLRISELETRVRRSAFDEVDLALVCQDAFDLYAPLAEAKDISMTFSCVAPVVVTGDGDLLREAVANLVENAIKFTPRGGSVALSCGEDGTLVRVSDTGIGVAAEDSEKIFKRFQRAKRTQNEAGSGLGLNMASTIAELHGFSLRLSSKAPEGARFEIRGTEAIRGRRRPDRQGSKAVVGQSIDAPREPA